MVDIEEKTLDVADGDVDPGKDLADLLLRDNLGTVAGHDGLEVCVRSGVITDNGRTRFNILLDLCVDGLRLKIIDDNHLDVPDGRVFVAFLRRVALHGLGHHQDLRLPLAATAFLERLSLLIIRHFRREEPFIEFHHVLECVLFIPFAHRYPQFMKHRPNRSVSLVPELALELRRGETLLRGREQMDGCEPVQQRELAPVHHGIGRKALPVVALFALETFLVILPVMVDAFALGAYNALPYPVLLQLALAGFLVGKLLGEINQVHRISSFVGTKIAPDCANLWRKIHFR